MKKYDIHFHKKGNQILKKKTNLTNSYTPTQLIT